MFVITDNRPELLYGDDVLTHASPTNFRSLHMCHTTYYYFYYLFGGYDRLNSAVSVSVCVTCHRQQAVQNAMKHAWAGYKTYAWGKVQCRTVIIPCGN